MACKPRPVVTALSVHLLGIKQFVVAINKMDLLGFDQQRFEQIKQDYLQFARAAERTFDSVCAVVRAEWRQRGA